ncbi:MAG: acyltransferase [Ignavibacteriales bacterium]|nr:acyltransferase [Ignavibacteriales bacterium]
MSRPEAGKPFSIAAVQLSTSDDREENFAKAERAIDEAASKGARIVVLPELFQTRYFCQREDVDFFDLAESVPGPSVERLREKAHAQNVAIVASLFERRAAGVYHNTAVVIDADGAYLGKYRKTHIPDDPGYYEKFYFTPGDLGFQVFHTKYGAIGVLICWDQWFPEAARLTAMKGADVLVYPTAIGWHPDEKESHGAKQRESWTIVQRGHAVANGVPVVTANRVGFERANEREGGVEFWGSSFIVDAQGQPLATAPEDDEAVIVAEIDPSASELQRRNWPFFRDRRVDLYGDLDERFLSDR